MSLPKTLTPKLIGKLNEVCESFRRVQCENECDDVGWCDACWIVVGGGYELQMKTCQPGQEYKDEMRQQHNSLQVPENQT